MPNVHNMSLTAAIDVLFSVNFAVVFDFMYFRFRPTLKKISVMHVIKLGFAPVSFPPG